MPSIETSIWLALKGRVQSLVLTPALPIAWPNEAFTKPPTGYMRVTWVPNATRRLWHGSDEPQQRVGILQVDVYGPKNQNAAVAIEIAGKIAAHFPTDLPLANGSVSARVTKAPDVSQPIADDTHLQVPVTIQYEVMA